jgi:hypothetical protein
MKRSYVSIFSCIAALAVIPVLSYADDASRNQEIAQRFAKCDINHDGNKGYLTVAEIQAAAD